MILGYTLIIIINASLFFGGFEGVANAFNIADATLWVMAILNALAILTPANDLVVTNNKLRRISGLTFSVLTIFHAVFWGFVWAGVIWGFSITIMYIRRSELLKKQNNV